MKTIFLALFVITFSCFIMADDSATEHQPNATDLVKTSDLLLRGEKSSSHHVEFVVNRPGQTIARKMIVRLKEKKYSFTHFTKPLSDRDTTILKREHSMWMFTPKVRKNVMIPFNMMHQGVLGSDFTYDDILKESTYTDDYSHEIVGKSKQMSTEENGDVYIVDLHPLPGRPVTYKKLRLWIRTKGGYMMLRTQYYNEKLEVTRVLSYSEIKEVDGRQIPTVWEMSDLQNEGHTTVYKVIEGSYNKIEDDNLFAPRSLENPPKPEWESR